MFRHHILVFDVFFYLNTKWVSNKLRKSNWKHNLRLIFIFPMQTHNKNQEHSVEYIPLLCKHIFCSHTIHSIINVFMQKASLCTATILIRAQVEVCPLQSANKTGKYSGGDYFTKELQTVEVENNLLQLYWSRSIFLKLMHINRSCEIKRASLMKKQSLYNKCLNRT